MEHLPAGCALGRSQGGSAAWSVESMLIRELELTVRNVAYSFAGAKGPKPDYLELPKPAREAQEAARTMSAKERAWQARQERAAANS